MPFTIVRQDIAKMRVDAIVNAANTGLLAGGGVCGAIFSAAGADELQRACNAVAPIDTGGAAITPGFALPAKYIIHAAGPVYRQNDAAKCEALLRSSYTNSLLLALEYGCKSIAFPLISSGIYGYPKEEALHVAASAIRDFLFSHDMDVYLAIFDRDSFLVSRGLIGEVESYIDENYIEAHSENERELLSVERTALYEGRDVEMAHAPAFYTLKPSASASQPGLSELVGELDEPFSQMLLRLIDKKGMTDTEVYKRANIDRKLFSKIRTGKGYMPSRRTAIALAVALRLTLNETDDLLRRAGFALSHSRKFDVIVEYFIVNGKYDIFEINEVLFRYDQPLLGA